MTDGSNSFAQLYQRRWSDPNWRIGFDAIGVYDLMKSYPTRNWAGVLPYQPRKWARDVGDDVGRLESVVNEVLIPALLVVVDFEEEALVRPFLRDDIVWRNADTNVMGALNDMLKAKSLLLRAARLEELKLAWQTILDRGLTRSRNRAQEVCDALAASLDAAESEPSTAAVDRDC